MVDISGTRIVNPSSGTSISKAAGEVAGNIPVVGKSVGNFLEDAFSLGGTRPVRLKDTTHAARRFSLDRESYTEVPRPKFLFWVQFFGNGFSDRGGDKLRIREQSRRWAEGISFLVKYIDKPKITPTVEEIHQYNKRRLIHTGLTYDPVSIRFHDSVSDGALHFWQDYFQWYFADGRGKDTNSWLYDQTNPDMRGDDWGFSPNDAYSSSFTNNFLTEMKLWQFWGGYYTAMSFVNPKIITFDHDANDYSEGAIGSEITLQMRYEGVVYHAEKESINNAQALGGMRDEEKRALLLDLGDYYNVPNIRANADMFSRLGGQALQGVIENVLRGGEANAGDVLNNVLRGAIPVTKASINALKNQVFNNTIRNVGLSALNTFGDFSFGSSTDSPKAAPNQVVDPRIISYGLNADGTTRSSIATRGKGTPVTGKFPTAPDFTGIGGDALQSGRTLIASANSAFQDSFGGTLASAARDIKDATGAVYDSAARVVGTMSNGIQITPQALAAINDAARTSTQYGARVISDTIRSVNPTTTVNSDFA